LLKSPTKQRLVVENELKEIKTKYTDRRRTQIVNLKQGKAASDQLTVKDVTPAESVWVVMAANGTIGKIATQNPPRLSGKDAPVFLLRTDSHQTLYMVNNKGQASAISVQNIPTVESSGAGVSFEKISPLREAGFPVAVFTLPPKEKQKGICLVTITRQGLIKKSLVTELKGPSSDLFTLVKVNDEDELVEVNLYDEKSNYLVASRNGMIIRFDGSEVRVMGLIAAGVNAIKLAPGDEVVGMVELEKKGEVVLISSNGTSWRIEQENIPLQGRYGQGVIGCRLERGVELVGVVFGKKNYQYALRFKKAAAKTYRVDAIGICRRAGRGEQLVSPAAGDRVVQVIKPSDRGE
jgi:DNA gyrase subunit A